MKSLAGLILAAGKSERMGGPKPLLRIFGKTFLENILDEALRSNLSDVKTILGYGADLILERLPQIRERVILNPDYESGQLSSIQTGIRSLEESNAEGVMLFLIDHPFVSRDLINTLIDCFSRWSNPIVIPSFQNRRGHPMIFGSEVFEDIMNAPLDQGAVAVVRKRQNRILHVQVDEPGILVDLDTPEAYQQYVVQAGKVDSK